LLKKTENDLLCVLHSFFLCSDFVILAIVLNTKITCCTDLYVHAIWNSDAWGMVMRWEMCNVLTCTNVNSGIWMEYTVMKLNLNRLRVYIFLADVCKEKVWGSILITCYTHTSRTFISCGSSRFFFFGGARFSSFLQLQFYVSTNIIHETDGKLHPFHHKIHIRIPSLLTVEVRNSVMLFVLLEIRFGRLGKMKRKELHFMEQGTAFMN
jgi:hypothetical protein